MDSVQSTHYSRARDRGAVKRPTPKPPPMRDDPKGEPALLDWIVIFVGYVVAWKLLGFIYNMYPTGAYVFGGILIGVFLCMLFRERYHETLRDRRAGLR